MSESVDKVVYVQSKTKICDDVKSSSVVVAYYEEFRLDIWNP